MTARSRAPLLIAVAGLGPRAGATTTTLALAQTWQGPEPSLLVEADPAGGVLAGLVDADPYLGLASLARAQSPGTAIDAGQLAEHLQFLPGGVALLAAPPRHDTDRALPAAKILTAQPASWHALGATVFADRGVPEPISAPDPVLATADACVIVVRADLHDPELAAHRIQALTRHSPRRGVVLIGASAHSDFAAALGLPLLGTLPHSRASAEALLHGTRTPRRHPPLLRAARIISTALHHQLGTPTHRTTASEPARPPAARHQANAPSVYRLAQAPTHSPTPRAAEHPVEELAASVPPPPAAEPVLATEPEGAGPHSENNSATPAEPYRAPEPAAFSPTPEPTTPALELRIFGPTRIFWHAPEEVEGVEITNRLQPRSRDLLTMLALHPDGLSRARLTDLLWGDHPPERATGALTNALSRLRTSITTATRGEITGLLVHDRLHHRLSNTLVSVDYWDFNTAVAERRRATSDAEQAAAARRIAEIATSELAADLTDTWVEGPRESARRNALNALSWLATRITETDPRATLGLLETTAEHDPYNETVWQDILRLHARLGEYAALARTYSLMTRTLAEIDQKPSSETRELLEQLRRTTR
ncbi:BTAD domain-containing putative transcriptional regulator [Nocardia goodfellowii]